MFGTASVSLDLTTLYLVAALVATMLGALLIHFGHQESIRALGWWGMAYLIGGFVMAVWAVSGHGMHPVLSLALGIVGIVACGMVWNAARVFRGKAPSFFGLAAGAVVWALANVPIADPTSFRLLLGTGVIAGYAVLTANELWTERRKNYRRRWPAIAVPVLHGLVLMLPLFLGDFLGTDNATLNARSGWMAAFAIELVLYSVGTVFIVFMLVSERVVRAHKTAASIDPLTELFNRRGFSELGGRMIEREGHVGRAVSVLIFDIDYFKQVNDRFGHAAGDEVLKLFASILVHTLRVTDIVGRIGGEEFAALLACDRDEAVVAAERVRAAYESAGVQIDDQPLATGVSVGVACGASGTDLQTLLSAADAALYRAKRGGRNRVEVATEIEMPVSLTDARKAAVVARAPAIVHQFERPPVQGAAVKDAV